MDTATTLIVSTLVSATIAALVMALSHDRLPKDWHVTGNYAFGSTVCLLALSVVMWINALGWQWVVVAWLMWALPGLVVVAAHVQDETDAAARKRKREASEDDAETANA